MMRTAAFAPVMALMAFAMFVCRAQSVRAEDYQSPTDERVRISLGAIYVTSATTLRADSSVGVAGTTVDGEDELGLAKSVFEPKFEAMVRVDTRQRLSIDYFTLDRSGDAVVGSNKIVFRNVVFLSDDPLQTTLNLRTLGLTYGYSFWHSETLEIAATLGAHVTDISAIAKVETPTRHIIQTEDQAGPIPTVGLSATWVVSRRFYVDGRAQYLTAHVDNIDGSLGIYELNVLYRYRANVSLALGYTDIRAHLASAQSTETGLFDFNTHGPQMFLRIAF